MAGKPEDAHLPQLPVGGGGLGDDGGRGGQRGVQGVVPQVQRQRAGPDDGRSRRGNDDGLGDDLLDKRRRAVTR